jgi:hypothetical protein
MFHFVHSVFLNLFFPVDNQPEPGFPGPALYLTVLAAYWPFVIATAVSERQHLLKTIKKPIPTGPYKNVVRMHLLIFFFAGAAFVHLDNFLVYCVVLFTYFFPFRTMFGRRDQEQQNFDPGDSLSPSGDTEQRSG